MAEWSKATDLNERFLSVQICSRKRRRFKPGSQLFSPDFARQRYCGGKTKCTPSNLRSDAFSVSFALYDHTCTGFTSLAFKQKGEVDETVSFLRSSIN